MRQIVVPQITHIAAVDVDHLRKQSLTSAGSILNHSGRTEGGGSLDKPGTAGSPLATPCELRIFRRNSLINFARLATAPLPVPHISGVEVVFDDDSYAHTHQHGRDSEEASDSATGDDQAASPRDDTKVGHTYHSTFAPMLKPTTRSHVKIAAADILHLIAPEAHGDGADINPLVIGAAGSGVSAAFEDARLDLHSLVKHDSNEKEKEAHAQVGAGQLVEDFNNLAFGFQQGAEGLAAAAQRSQMLQQKLREKKIATKRRAASAAAVTMTAAEARAHARSTRQVMLAHRKMYYSNVPQPLAAPWLQSGFKSRDGDDGDDDEELPGSTTAAHLTSMKVSNGIPGQFLNRTPSSAGINGAERARPGWNDGQDAPQQVRRLIEAEQGVNSLFTRSSNGMRLSTVEEVVCCFRDSSEEDSPDAAIEATMPSCLAATMGASCGPASLEGHSPNASQMQRQPRRTTVPY